ncbi:DegQ family serine endoprotease [Caldimonas thermodepolymerans]|uniref:Probable periplasmic serine endoprotease DegP-like n=1 Tax=Caldimonas thermodepolymerans TaxID=215580 RepID=A0A2S5T8V1_9BURK|nr:DegQ family serine endoprotease [Caldimonas thermodepolymerans]PPE71287.1 serine peptidase [Caldimonas thermodepolymerans]QPC32461.1 DegQ family serine endoprotease [Caldimonas thermodepolymerans]RDH98849.1 serine protease Do [Caldimonas thermodepolymerans]UZG45257.1 DegQ family serine endoprotease [Caldimonas thermodepolymerans]
MTARIHTTGRFRHVLTALLAGACLALAQPAPAQSTGRDLPDFTVLVEQVGPSVVNIRTSARVSTRQYPGPQMDEEMQEFFRRFFGIPFPGPRVDPRRQQRPEQEELVPRGVGSGFVITSDGYIMTNAHVIEGADEVYVTLTDKREFKAKVVGSDKRTDVAVVKIDATGLPAVKIGDVGKLKVGEWVMAIGSPFGLDNTVTAGIVSAKQRETGDYLPFIQTDVAINPGNSGGPLINLRGEVVGINSQIYSRSGGFMGISFAIPIDEAMRVADQLRTTGRVIRGRIGVQIDQVTKEVAESIGLGKPVGALVRSVEDDGPAAKAGLEAGDIITRFDGKTIERASDLPRIVGNTKPGSKVTVQVFRRGSYRDIPVTVGEFEPERSASAGTPEPRPGGAPLAAAQDLGLAVADLTPAERRELGLKGGVRVTAADGPAARAGLREGDVILAVANVEVQDVKQLEAVLRKLDKGKPFNVLFRRGEWAQYAVIRPAR